MSAWVSAADSTGTSCGTTRSPGFAILTRHRRRLCRAKKPRFSQVTCSDISRKPRSSQQAGPVKDCPGCQRNLVPAFGALVPPLVHQFIRSFVPASRTTEPIRPTARRQILLASLLCGEVGLKLTKRLGERWSGHP